MKLGLVLECDVGGPDELVLTCMARRLLPDISVQCASLGSKKQVFLKGPEAAEQLATASACDLVLIIWDLKPYWEEALANTCKAEVADLRTKLNGLHEKVKAKIELICLTWELETWLIADDRAINKHLSTPAHKTKFKCRSPLDKHDAKAFLDGVCKEHRGRSLRYVDVREAIQIAQQIPDTRKIQGIPSFRRFANFVCGSPRADFKQAGDVCNDLGYQAKRLGCR